ncbi:DNA polymerase IV [Paenibacillus xerothermodurans]|uniref:DNA polymerase IV n=1 Tax=Paenibacillus xerothermodurans TaxID=1977292 RepID=A0A2W1N8M0_PAEXE|nr:DNA polymerase IV [Paenibacillus xerothermodurans]PZE20949.1 DNA polymerase IV [Paenibacillus xerothermodurans]
MNKKSNQSYPVHGRVILHIDMNAFYCSVHEAVEPELYKGKPTAVAGSVELRKGIIVTCSYPARARGIKTGMLVGQAQKMCPELILIRPNFDLYREFSRRFMKIVYDYSPLVEAMSIDECYVDITGSKQFGTPLEIASQIQDRIRTELALPCSIGVAPNKLLAKMASDMKKPNGISVLRKRDVPRVLWDKPCAELYGIGRKTADKLKRLHIHTLGQLAAADDKLLADRFGVLGPALKQAANGEDHSPVQPEREQSKSIGHTTTLPINFTELPAIRRVFLNLADQVGRRLRKQQLLAQTVQITIRDPDMRTITRAAKLQSPTESREDIYRMACQLFDEHRPGGKPVRLLGITLQNLLAKSETAVQLDLFDYQKQPAKEKLNKALDALRDKFGENAVLTAGMLSDDPSSLIRDHKARGTSLQMDHLRLKPLEDE